MSENIQSIANGTYTIGETSATNFIAGNGIKIDSPSAGTVRIGTDETVLFQTSTGVTGSITASESFSAFERVKVLYGRGYDNAHFIEFSGSQPNWDCWSYIVQNGSVILDNSLWSVSNNVVNKQYDERRTLGSTYKRETGAFPKSIWTIIGINRISGGNE